MHLLSRPLLRIWRQHQAPFSPRAITSDHPISIYAATKRPMSGWARAHSLSIAFLRWPAVFTVYGPWDARHGDVHLRKAILAVSRQALQPRQDAARFYLRRRRQPGSGSSHRSSAGGTARLDARRPDPSSSAAPWKIYNIRHNSVPEEADIRGAVLEQGLWQAGREEIAAKQRVTSKRLMPDVSDLERDIGFRPSTAIEDRLARFRQWYESITDIRAWRRRGSGLGETRSRHLMMVAKTVFTRPFRRRSWRRGHARC